MNKKLTLILLMSGVALHASSKSDNNSFTSSVNFSNFWNNQEILAALASHAARNKTDELVDVLDGKFFKNKDLKLCTSSELFKFFSDCGVYFAEEAIRNNEEFSENGLKTLGKVVLYRISTKGVKKACNGFVNKVQNSLGVDCDLHHSIIGKPNAEKDGVVDTLLHNAFDAGVDRAVMIALRVVVTKIVNWSN